MAFLDEVPTANEHPPWAVNYMNTTAAALKAANTTDVLALIAGQMAQFSAMMPSNASAVAQHAYAPGKWTLAESLVHVIDTERVFAYRIMRIARGDKTPLPGFDQDAWVPESRVSSRNLSDILTELTAVRQASVTLIRSLDDRAARQSGVASNAPISVRALVWMVAGHFAHHMEITRTRYLTGA